MFRYPAFSRIKHNGVPILSRSEIDTIAEDYIKDFDPDLLNSPHALDIESFVECYMGANVEYQYLSSNSTYFGMAVFYDLDKLPIYDPDTLRAEYICVKANTVIIENALIDTQRDTILRFTMGHEAGHLTLDQQYYSISKGQRSLFDSENISCVKCKRAYIETNFSLKTDIDWMEWQANYFSAALLMPKPAMQNILSNITGYSIDSQIEIIKDTFNVSKQAAEIRIRQLLSKEKIDPAQAVLF